MSVRKPEVTTPLRPAFSYAPWATRAQPVQPRQGIVELGDMSILDGHAFIPAVTSRPVLRAGRDERWAVALEEQMHGRPVLQGNVHLDRA